MRERWSIIRAVSVLCCLVSSFSLLRGQPLLGEETAEDEIQIVIRVSKSLFEDLTQDEIAVSVPIDRSVRGMRVSGQARARGRTHVDLETLDGRAEFTIIVKGAVVANFQADAGPAAVHASTSVRFVTSNSLQAVLLETVLVDWDVAHDFLRDVLPAKETNALRRDISVERHEGWSVILIGQQTTQLN